MREHPPALQDWNKRIVQDIACPEGAVHSGALEYSRWAALGVPRGVAVNMARAVNRIEDAPGFFDYARVSDPAGAVEWHVNFADPVLFAAYGSPLFAQDEIQVAEHPALGALCEALHDGSSHAWTVEGGSPTPVLVTGVERRCHVATEADPAQGRPIPLYGNSFSRADEATVNKATTRIDPPTITNIIAMAATTGSGTYSDVEIAYTLVTAQTAFAAAVQESQRFAGPGKQVIVHTGFWGCGAFGGHRTLMTTLQTIAAEMAGVDRIVFHTGMPGGEESINSARKLIGWDLAEGSDTIEIRELIQRIVNLGFVWGVGDGN